MNKQDVSLTELQPWRVFDVDTYMQWGDAPRDEGDVINIITPEEAAQTGWAPTTGTNIIIPVKPIIESFEGTDREGKIRLTNYPHLRRVKTTSIQDWLKVYGIWSTDFDPNASTLYGLPDSTIKTQIRSGNIAGSSFDISSFYTYDGYLPLQVTIKTDRWTAFPDTYGKPSENRVRSVQMELLGTVTKTITVSESSSDEIDFSSWLSGTTADDLLNLVHNKALKNAILQLTGSSTVNGFTAKQLELETEVAIQLHTGRRVQRRDSLMKILQDQAKRQKKSSISELTGYQKLKEVYNNLKQLGLLSLQSSKTVTETSTVNQTQVYKTKFGPIISGRSGSMVRLYWVDTASGLYIPINPNNVAVDPENQIISVTATPPATAYNAVAADYKYLLKEGAEDYFSEVITSATVPATGSTDFAGFIRETSRSLPITRNMTDYTNGKIPLLKPPVFDKMSKDYYPVIEYYLSDDGTLIFARDFFLYGDQPAEVEVKYDTLAVKPRLVLDVTRLDGPTKSPHILNLSLNVREGSSAPTREVV